MLSVHQIDISNRVTMQDFHDADDVDSEDDVVGEEDDDLHDPDEELPFDISAEDPVDIAHENDLSRGGKLFDIDFNALNMLYLKQ